MNWNEESLSIFNCGLQAEDVCIDLIFLPVEQEAWKLWAWNYVPNVNVAHMLIYVLLNYDLLVFVVTAVSGEGLYWSNPAEVLFLCFAAG